MYWFVCIGLYIWVCLRWMLIILTSNIYVAIHFAVKNFVNESSESGILKGEKRQVLFDYLFFCDLCIRHIK